MGMLVATPIAIATSHVLTKKKEKMKEWKERKKKGRGMNLLVFFFSFTQQIMEYIGPHLGSTP